MKLALTPYDEGIKRVFWNNLMAFNTLIAAMLSMLLVGCRCSGSAGPPILQQARSASHDVHRQLVATDDCSRFGGSRRSIWAEAGTLTHSEKKQVMVGIYLFGGFSDKTSS